MQFSKSEFEPLEMLMQVVSAYSEHRRNIFSFLAHARTHLRCANILQPSPTNKDAGRGIDKVRGFLFGGCIVYSVQCCYP